MAFRLTLYPHTGITGPSYRATASHTSIIVSTSARASAGVSPKAEHERRSGTSATQAPSVSDQTTLMWYLGIGNSRHDRALPPQFCESGGDVLGAARGVLDFP